MVDYKIFQAKAFDLKRVDAGQMDKCRRLVSAYAIENGQLYKQARQRHTQLLQLAASIWGIKSKEYVYLRRAKAPLPPDKANANQLRKLERAFAEHQQRQVRNAKKRAYRLVREARQQASRDELILAGYKPGKDFSWFTPIRDAQRLAGDRD